MPLNSLLLLKNLISLDFDYEITLLTVRTFNDQGEVDTYFCAPIGHRQEDGDYRESWQPQEMTATAMQNSQDIALKVINNIGGLGLFGVDLLRVMMSGLVK